MPRLTIGGFEFEVLQAVQRLAGQGYGVSIAEHIQSQTGRRPAPGAIYTTLERLENKGFLTSQWGEPTAERGGRRKRIYSITGAGVFALNPPAKTGATERWRGKLQPQGA